MLVNLKEIRIPYDCHARNVSGDPGMEIKETNLTENFYKFQKAKYLTGVFFKAKHHGTISGQLMGGGATLENAC